jgi:UDP-GlcNAc:undecaprenyl-phosphate GlcNAc-1-phosphate transferase
MHLITAFLIGFFLTTVITPKVIRFAITCNCLDIPGGRRTHKKVTPRWGGFAFFIGVLPVLFAVGSGRMLISYVAASAVMIGIGMLDDRKQLPYTVKFGGMLAAVAIVIFGGNVVVHTIGDYGPWGTGDLGRLSIPFTFFGIVGVTNAINLLDGLNGLAGGVSLLGFLFMGIAAAHGGNMPLAIVCFAFVGALAAFLRFNFPHARVFMGDTGSLFLGFSLSVVAVVLTQNRHHPVDPMLPVLVLFIPIFDALRVMFVRMLNRRNPFHADKSHLHYLLVRRRVPFPITVAFLWALTAVFGIAALIMIDEPSFSFLEIAVYGAVIMGLLTEALVWRQKKYAPFDGGVTRRRLLSPRGTFLL